MDAYHVFGKRQTDRGVKGDDEVFDTVRVGANISNLRKEANLTQMELAERMDVSFQAVSNWERGQSMPDISRQIPIKARVLSKQRTANWSMP